MNEKTSLQEGLKAKTEINARKKDIIKTASFFRKAINLFFIKALQE